MGQSFRATICYKSKRRGFKKKPAIFSTGSYSFVIDGKEIPFDFDESETSCAISPDGTLYFETFLRDFNTEYYIEEHKKNGLSENDITSEFLHKVDKLEDINYECWGDEKEEIFIELEPVSFVIDGKLIPPHLILRYNEQKRQ